MPNSHFAVRVISRKGSESFSLGIMRRNTINIVRRMAVWRRCALKDSNSVVRLESQGLHTSRRTSRHCLSLTEKMRFHPKIPIKLLKDLYQRSVTTLEDTMDPKIGRDWSYRVIHQNPNSLSLLCFSWMAQVLQVLQSPLMTNFDATRCHR
jgi:hypothetical protein